MNNNEQSRSIFELLAHLRSTETQRHKEAEQVYLETIRNSRFLEEVPKEVRGSHEA